MTADVEATIEEVLSGRIDAYADIIRRYQDEIWRIVAFALRDVATTEDLVQQVFVDAYTNLGSYERGRDFGPWLHTMARNAVRKEIRRSAREGRKLRAYHEHLAERLEGTADAGGHEERLRGALEKCREKLSPSASKALDLRYTRSMGFGEIAEALGRTIEATRQMLWRVRAALRRCIEERTAQP